MTYARNCEWVKGRMEREESEPVPDEGETAEARNVSLEPHHTLFILQDSPAWLREINWFPELCLIVKL